MKPNLPSPWLSPFSMEQLTSWNWRREKRRRMSKYDPVLNLLSDNNKYWLHPHSPSHFIIFLKNFLHNFIILIFNLILNLVLILSPQYYYFLYPYSYAYPDAVPDLNFVTSILLFSLSLSWCCSWSLSFKLFPQKFHFKMILDHFSVFIQLFWAQKIYTKKLKLLK